MTPGFDVSGWSGDVDFAAARKAGMEFVYCRVGRGVPALPSTDSEGLDVRWERNRDAALAAGLRVGGYWRFFPTVDLGEQVVAFTDRLEGTTLPPMVDVEDQHPDWSPTQLTDWAASAMQQVQARTGRTPLLYSYRWFIGTHKVGDDDVPNALEIDRLLWWYLGIAARIETWPDERATLHQYVLNTKVPWAVGNVDLDRWRGPLPG